MHTEAATFGMEQRALKVGKWANLAMAIAGVAAAWLSNSQALLVDGLFSMVGFLSAIVAIRISGNTRLGADDTRPMGYAVEESIYQTFRVASASGAGHVRDHQRLHEHFPVCGGGRNPAAEL